MWFGVLGSLVARDEDGSPVRLSGPARRQLLAALICRVGQSVPAGVLIEDLWGDAAPVTAVKTLHSHILRLRRDLSPADGPSLLIVTEPGGYRLAVAADAVDAGSFEHDLAEGVAALQRGECELALARLDAALGWWRAEAYAEFSDAAFAVAERLRLNELHAIAHERRVDAALALGRAASLVPDLERVLVVEPYRERYWEQLMIALYRAGRQADALGAYKRVRDRLVDDLGVEPGPGLRLLEHRILDQDRSLLAPVHEVIAVAAAARTRRGCVQAADRPARTRVCRATTSRTPGCSSGVSG